MSETDTERPTREQVDADLARADLVHNGGTNEVRLIVHRLAAEVRALRAEQAAALAALNADGPLVSAARFVREAADAFAARTAQPAVPDRAGRCGDRSLSVLGGAPSFCDLRAGHAGWHEVQGGAQWSHAALTADEDVPARLNGAALIAAERDRQVADEGWTPEHDAEHLGEELAIAAACYAIPNTMRRFPNGAPALWPWHPSWWKPSPDDRVRELVKAGALIAAEIDRAAALAQPTGDPS